MREKLTEAIDLLGRIDEVKRLSGLVAGKAAEIDKEADGLRGGLDLLLGQAMGARRPASPTACLPPRPETGAHEPQRVSSRANPARTLSGEAAIYGVMAQCPIRH